jgi:hypothetical protein
MKGWTRRSSSSWRSGSTWGYLIHTAISLLPYPIRDELKPSGRPGGFLIAASLAAVLRCAHRMKAEREGK